MSALPVSQQPSAEPPLTERQAAVLAAALALMVESGDDFSMSSVAKAAACSKETLYRWFGDRDGLLTAVVRWQAAKVAMPALPDGPMDRETLEKSLAEFAASWLTVIAGPVSIALNRLAITHAARGTSPLGAILHENGPRAMARRLAPLFTAGERQGILGPAADDEHFSVFFGLVIADTQLAALLGANDFTPQSIERRALKAASRFLALFSLQGEHQ
jgi:AcrR family transcriptional regulator